MHYSSIINETGHSSPDSQIKIKDIFNEEISSSICFKKSLSIPYFSKKSKWVPKIDLDYVFDTKTTTAILLALKYNKKMLLQGFHGTGKSSHIEQVAARLNYPCIRINLDSHISRSELIGKDAIVIKDNKQITTFKEGILPWAMQNPVILVLDEYDAGRPDVMFVIQRILESDGKLNLADSNKIIEPSPSFRIFATSNTIGMGDISGLYHGTQQINQAQMDRWNMVCSLNYLENKHEEQILKSKFKKLKIKTIKSMVNCANLTRSGFSLDEISSVMSPRTLIHWAENYEIFKDLKYSFRISFLNKCEENEREIIKEYYQRCFNDEFK